MQATGRGGVDGDGARRRLWGLLSLEPGLLWLRCRPAWASGTESDLTVTAPGVWPRGGTRGKLLNLSGPSVLHLWKRPPFLHDFVWGLKTALWSAWRAGGIL